MKLLLDTQTFLWWLASPGRLNEAAGALLESEENESFLYAASSWEIAIKYAIGKLPLPRAPEMYVASGLEQGGFLPLPVQHAHALRVAHLPPHHKDPFDRLLIAQAQVEGLTIVTADPMFEAYDVEVVRAG